MALTDIAYYSNIFDIIAFEDSTLSGAGVTSTSQILGADILV
jgi:hypothetical protein